MPQGKGTYGSQVGRPSKKQKYQAGGQTGENEAVLDAAMTGQELKSISLEGIPTENAPDRSEASPMGDEVGTGMYREGGKIKEKVAAIKEDIRTRVQDVRHRVGEKAEKRKQYKRKRKIGKLEKKLHKLKGKKPIAKGRAKPPSALAKPGPPPPRPKKKKEHKESDWKEMTPFGPQFKKEVS